MYKNTVLFTFENKSLRRSLCYCFVVFLIISITATTGFSQTTTLSPAAQEAITKGIMATKVPDYLLAIRYFEDARKTAPLSPEVFFNLGLAESKIPGRELRAICWFGAYLSVNPAAPNAVAVKEQIDMLDVISQSNISRFLKTVQDAAGQISGDKQSENFYNMAELLAKAGDIAGARKTADLIQRMDWKSKAQIAIAVAQAKAGDFAGAQKTADLLQDSEPNQHWKSSALRDIAIAQADAGDIAGSRKTADLIQRMSMKSRAQTAIAVAQAKAGDFAGAQKTADLLQDSEPNQQWKSFALRDIAVAQANVGNIIEAQKTASLILYAGPNGRWKSNTLTAIALAQAKDGDIAGAQNTTDLIQDTISKRSAQTAIGVAQVKSGDSTGAQKTFASALMTADLIQDTISKRIAQTAIAEAQAKNGDITGAQKTFASALKTADLIQDAYRKSVAQSNIAVAQAKAGDIAGAQKIADLIQDAGWKSYAQSSIAQVRLSTRINNTVSAWLKNLDDDYKSNACPLNTEPFLDLSNYLKSINASDPQKFFEGLQGIADKIVSAQNAIKKMMKEMK